MALITTPGAADANSYMTTEEADGLVVPYDRDGSWPGEDVETREARLVAAAYRLNQLRWTGRRASQDQALAWPRTNARDADGYRIPADTIPAEVKRAQVRLALALIPDDVLADTGLEGFASVRVGPISVEVRDGFRGGSMPADIMGDLWGLMGGMSPYNFAIERA